MASLAAQLATGNSMGFAPDSSLGAITIDFRRILGSQVEGSPASSASIDAILCAESDSSNTRNWTAVGTPNSVDVIVTLSTLAGPISARIRLRKAMRSLALAPVHQALGSSSLCVNCVTAILTSEIICASL